MSFILLGILNSQVSGAAGGSYELIESNILTSSASSVTFSSIPQDYKHLQIRATTRTDQASTAVGSELLLNSDTGANYAMHFLYGNGSSVLSGSGTSQTYAYWAVTNGNNETANVYTAIVTDILDYSSSNKNTTIRTLNGTAGSSVTRIYERSALWMNTNAVTSITLRGSGGTPNFMAGSRFSLYGIRG